MERKTWLHEKEIRSHLNLEHIRKLEDKEGLWDVGGWEDFGKGSLDLGAAGGPGWENRKKK